MTHLPSHDEPHSPSKPRFRALHVADLHIPLQGADVAYAWSVWEEILSLAASHGVDALLLSGDIFDQYAGFQAHHQKFFASVAELPCPVVYIFGNHEFLGAPPRLPDYETPSNLHLLTTAPEWLSLGNARIYAIPHGSRPLLMDQASETEIIVGMIHGEPEYFTFAAWSDDAEEGGHRFDEAFFAESQFALVACGHIHKRHSYQVGRTLFHFPGSSRVWRKGETGARLASLLDLSPNEPPQITAVRLQTAGAIRTIKLKLPAEAPELMVQLNLPSCEPTDYLEIAVTGHIGFLSLWQQQKSLLEFECLRHVRKVRWIEDELIVLGDMLDHPMLRRFLQQFNATLPQWQQSGIQLDAGVVETAKDLGIKLIYDLLAPTEQP